jgi:hypothetical protein
MPTMLLDRPIDELLASAMPPNRPGDGGGDSGTGLESAEPEHEEDDEDESSPS